ncbi:S1C family serine protease [Deinococcus sonorensis]|uniref:Trypsin-like peptidase domain-containing protein n=2 Tax=Deinococcus sonorensis TaxID=309891 RepID=A0AAU7UEY1_9DEIO
MTNTTIQDLSSGLADTVETASRSVVMVLGGRPVSGTVVAPGQVLTAAHVLHDDDVKVRTADGRELSATVAGRDPATDLALLRVDGLDLEPLAAAGELRVGELLLAVGRPTHGVQASLGLVQRRPERGWMPAGAEPFRGVTGGALVSAAGQLVGVLNAGVQRGTLLAVPVERAMKVAALLAQDGRVPRGYLGVATQPVHFPEEREPQVPGAQEEQRRGPGPRGDFGPRGGPRGPWGREGGPRGPRRGRVGLTVVQLDEGSPAAQAGLLKGDVLLAVDGDAIRHPHELTAQVRERAGEALTLRVLRGGQEHDVTLTVGER